MESVAGKSVIITGGSKGIGRGIAIECAKKGANIMITALNTDALEKTAEELRALGAEVNWMIADSSKGEDWAALVSKTMELYGSIDYVFSNAGISFNKSLLSATPDEWQWIMNVNFMAHLQGLGAFLPIMMQQEEGGHIIFTASFASFTSPATMVPYACSKAATMALAEGLQNEMSIMGFNKIRTSLVMPALVSTNIQHNEASRPDTCKDVEANSNELDKAVWKTIDDSLNDPTAALGTISLEVAGKRIVEQTEKGLFYIYTHRDFVKQLALEKANRMVQDKPPVEPGSYQGEYYELHTEEF